MPQAPCIIITRVREQAQALSEGIAALGCRPLHIPVFRIAPACDGGAALDRALSESWDWCVLTSGNALRQIMQRPRPLRADQIAVVGQATAEIAQAAGLQVDCIPAQQDAEGLLAALGNRVLPGQRCLLPQANNARPVLLRGLKQLGVEVVAVEAYQALTLAAPERPLPKAISALTMASSATVERFCQLYAADLPRLRQQGCVWIAIGAHTFTALSQHDLSPRMQARTPNVQGLIAAVAAVIGDQ